LDVGNNRWCLSRIRTPLPSQLTFFNMFSKLPVLGNKALYIVFDDSARASKSSALKLETMHSNKPYCSRAQMKERDIVAGCAAPRDTLFCGLSTASSGDRLRFMAVPPTLEQTW
jgi:hypothetical protein